MPKTRTQRARVGKVDALARLAPAHGQKQGLAAGAGHARVVVGQGGVEGAPVAAAEAPPKRTRAISGSVASMLAASMPKYTPPPPPPTPEELAKKAEEEAADLREIDKPKNGIVRLDKVIVREERPAVLAERTVNTKQGLRDLAMRRYITDADRALNRYSIPLFSGWSPGSDKGSSTEERALFMYSEDERLKNMADLADNTNMVMKSNAADGAAVKRAAQDTYRRSDDFGWRGNSPR